MKEERNGKPVNENNQFARVEWQHLQEGLQRSHKERFLFMTRLYKIQQTLFKASIIHKPFQKPS